jgi:hypothetical protein
VSTDVRCRNVANPAELLSSDLAASRGTVITQRRLVQIGSSCRASAGVSVRSRARAMVRAMKCRQMELPELVRRGERRTPAD